jgi:hypothetical protein
MPEPRVNLIVKLHTNIEQPFHTSGVKQDDNLVPVPFCIHSQTSRHEMRKAPARKPDLSVSSQDIIPDRHVPFNRHDQPLQPVRSSREYSV